MAERTRKKLLKLYVDDEEWNMIQHKMGQIPTNNFSEYARKMLIDGYIIKRDFSEIKALTKEFAQIGHNINQIARRMNETRNVYEEDVKNIYSCFRSLRNALSKKIEKLIDLSGS